MSQQNVEIVQRFIDHWNEADEPLWTEIDPDAAFVIDPGAFLAGTYRGHEGIRNLLRLVAEIFDRFRFEVDEVLDTGDLVVVLGHARVRGVQSGATGTQQGAIVFQIREGRVIAYRSYLRQEEALEAAGLRE